MRIGADPQKGVHGSGALVTDSSVQWGDTTDRGGVRIRANLGEVKDHSSLSCRIPVTRPGRTDRRGVQRFATTTVSSADVGTGFHQPASERDHYETKETP